MMVQHQDDVMVNANTESQLKTHYYRNETKDRSLHFYFLRNSVLGITEAE